MNLNFKTTIDACVGACKPASAWSTTGEVDTLINYAVEYAVKYGNTRWTNRPEFSFGEKVLVLKSTERLSPRTV